MSRVFMGRIPMHTRESDVERFFRGYGQIRDITLKKGYGFVEFDDYRDAEDAIEDLNGKDLLGERVTLEIARGRRSSGGRGGGRDRGGRYSSFGSSSSSSSRRPVWLDKAAGFGGRHNNKYGPPVRTGYAAVVENLSSRTSWQDLKDYCRKVGKVTYADAHKRRVGEGIVEFSSYDDLKDAIHKLDDTELGGRRIRIYEEKKSHRRSRSYSRSRSKSPRRRSRSPSRSRSRSGSPRQRRRSPVRSRTPSRSRSRSRSLSPAKSRSRSPMNDNHDGRDSD